MKSRKKRGRGRPDPVVVRLADKDRSALKALLAKGEGLVRTFKKARVLQLMDAGQSTLQAAKAAGVSDFCVVEPKRGRHMIKITKNRKASQFAEVMRDVGRAYPSAEKIHIVMDNLSTHKRKSLLDHFGPKRGANLWNRFEVHYTPKHGSWLNQAEIEISMFSRECLGKDRIATRVTLAKRAAAWVQQVNEERRKLKWGFTREKARSKFNYQP